MPGFREDFQIKLCENKPNLHSFIKNHQKHIKFQLKSTTDVMPLNKVSAYLEALSSL